MLVQYRRTLVEAAFEEIPFFLVWSLKYGGQKRNMKQDGFFFPCPGSQDDKAIVFGSFKFSTWLLTIAKIASRDRTLDN
jgi:hypothetical protein